MKRRLDLFFPPAIACDPVIYRLSRKYDIVFNIRRAQIWDTMGKMVLELEGEPALLDEAVTWLKGQGVKAEPVTHDALEG